MIHDIARMARCIEDSERSALHLKIRISRCGFGIWKAWCRAAKSAESAK